MSGSVTVDTSRLERAVRVLVDSLEGGGLTAARHRAETTAGRVEAHVPVRTGRLRSTVVVDFQRKAYAVHYGGRLPYARYIENRSHPVKVGLKGCKELFYEDGKRVARVSVKRLK